MSTIWDKLEQINRHFEELGEQMASPEVIANPKQLSNLAQQRAGIEDVVAKYREYTETTRELETTREMLNDGLDKDMLLLVKQEVEKLTTKQDRLLQELKISLGCKG